MVIYGLGHIVEGVYTPILRTALQDCTQAFNIAADATHIVIGHGGTAQHADFMRRCCEYFPWLPKWGADYSYDAETPIPIMGESLYKVLNLVCFARCFHEKNLLPEVLSYMDKYGVGAGILMGYMKDSRGLNKDGTYNYYGGGRNWNHDLFSEHQSIYDICKLAIYPEKWEPVKEYIITDTKPVKFLPPPSYICAYSSKGPWGKEVFRAVALAHARGDLTETDIYNLIMEAANGEEVFNDLSRFYSGTAVR